MTFLTLNLSSCYDSTEVDDMAYVLSIGIDEAENENNLYTFQFAVPLNISGGVKTGFAESEESVTIQSISTSAGNLFSALESINSKLAKEINISHCKLVLFSEKISSKSMEETIININKFNKFNPDTLVAMCKEKPFDYLNSISSPFEKNPARYFDMFFNKDLSLLSLKTTIAEFDKRQTLAIPLLSTDGNIKSVVINKFEKKLELNQEETFALNALTGNFKNGYFSLKDNNISIMLSGVKKPKINVNTSGKYPVFNIELDFQGQLYTESESNVNYNALVENYIKNICVNFLKKTANMNNLDVAELIKHSRSDFLTDNAFNKYNWKDKFPDSTFEILVNLTLIK